MKDHSKSYPGTYDGWVPWGLIFRTGYGRGYPYRLPYSLDGQLPAYYSSVNTPLVSNPAVRNTNPA
jgi:hypothetical protein